MLSHWTLVIYGAGKAAGGWGWKRATRIDYEVSALELPTLLNCYRQTVIELTNATENI